MLLQNLTIKNIIAFKPVPYKVYTYNILLPPPAIPGQASHSLAYKNCKYRPICPLLFELRDRLSLFGKLNFAIEQSLFRLLVMK